MKTRNWQFLILVLMFGIEYFMFSDHAKYEFMTLIWPDFKIFFIQNFVWFKFSILAILLLICYLLYSRLIKAGFESFFIIFLIKQLQRKPNNGMGLFNMLYIIISLAAISKEFLYNTMDNSLNGGIFGCFMIIYCMIIAILFIPSPASTSKVIQPKVMITALSLMNAENLRSSLKEMNENHLKDKWLDQIFYNPDGTLKKVKNLELIWGPWNNLDPIRKSIIVHTDSLRQIILIASREADEAYKKLPPELQPKHLISEFLKQFEPNLQIDIQIYSVGTSGNDMIKNSDTLDCIIKSLYSQKYKDQDILFNLTGGTVAISGAMILKALPGERLAESTNQDTGKIEMIELSVLSVKELWNELLEKVDKV